MSVIIRLIHLLRYRFFLFAGIFPFLLGQVIAFYVKKAINWHYFWWASAGIFLVLIGVELFNEYFDAKDGGDRIFSQKEPNIPDSFFLLALSSMLFAFFIAVYLALHIGWPILLFSILGFFGAYFYVGPPLKWAYRGLGELVIGLSYGPFMVLGSYYLQTGEINSIPFIASLICGLLIFSLAILNEVPDYIQDSLVGKRNLVVRFGRQKAVALAGMSLVCAFILLGIGIWQEKIPYLALSGFFALPLLLKAARIAGENMERPEYFIPVIRIGVALYLIIASFLGISYLIV